ncbi:MAG: type II toxin-antitoxin system ParD family antitoxin [Pirellulales bacterium]
MSPVALPPDLIAFVQDKVSSGSYETENEVIREALRLLRERDQVREMRLAALRSEIQVGLDESARGQVAPLDMDEIKRSAAEMLLQNKSR